MAYVTLGQAVRTALVIGLQHEPSEQFSREEEELRRRLWWTLFTIEVKDCIKLGRPWSVQLSDITCALPSDDHTLAAISGSNFKDMDEDATWLTYNVQSNKLFLIVRCIYVSFFDRCSVLLSNNEGQSLYDHPESLELAGEFLISRMREMQCWTLSLPEALKTKRKAEGESYSTDRSPLAVDTLTPLWLQRQRLILEISHHNVCMNLYRPFLCFTSFSNTDTPSAEGCAISCLNHAITITNIMHQVLTETDIFNGWHEAFQWQWNATLSLIGFVLANPLSPSCSSARRALDGAMAIFEMMGTNFTIAANAAYITRELKAKSELVLHRFCSGVADLSEVQFRMETHNFTVSSGNDAGSGLPESAPGLDGGFFGELSDNRNPSCGLNSFVGAPSPYSAYTAFGDVFPGV